MHVFNWRLLMRSTKSDRGRFCLHLLQQGVSVIESLLGVVMMMMGVEWCIGRVAGINKHLVDGTWINYSPTV